MKVIPETRLLKRIVFSNFDIYVLLHVLVFLYCARPKTVKT